MKAAKIFIGIISIFITLPIAMYLQYRVLEIIGASETMWFLYWIYVPLVIAVSALAKFSTDSADNKKD